MASMVVSEETPLLWQNSYRQQPLGCVDVTLPFHRQDEQPFLKHKDVSGKNPHAQFCALVGCPPSNLPISEKFSVPKKSLYGRTIQQLSNQRRAYNLSASLNNLMLLSQVILGATLTALGASSSSHILITIFGVMNTIIAGLVAYLKSRGQPMRARMYRDDLERVVDEIENSEVMWRGISEGIHGYDEIDTDDVTVRSEVARLTRLYERAIKLNGMNNPDMYMAGAGGFDGNTNGGVRPNTGGPGLVPTGVQATALPAVTAPSAPQPSGENPGPAVPLFANPEDVAPATTAKVQDPSTPVKDEKKHESKKDSKKTSTDGSSDDQAQSSELSASNASSDNTAPTSSPSPQSTSPPSMQAQAQLQPITSTPAKDPDASPATAARLKPKRTGSKVKESESSISKKVAGDDEQ